MKVRHAFTIVPPTLFQVVLLLVMIGFFVGTGVWWAVHTRRRSTHVLLRERFVPTCTSKPQPQTPCPSKPTFAGIVGWTANNYAIDVDNINRIICKQPCIANYTDLIFGGWCMCAYNDHTWQKDPNDSNGTELLAPINTILSGSFQSDPTITPSYPNTTNTSHNVYLTIGGAGVGDSLCLVNDRETHIQNAGKIKAVGFCFDMEGCLNYKTHATAMDTIATFIAYVNTHYKDKNYKFIYTPQGDIDPVTYPEFFKHADKFNYVAPMLYWGDDTYKTVNKSTIYGWIQNWINNGWKESQIILTFQSKSAYTYKDTNSIIEDLADAVINGLNP